MGKYNQDITIDMDPIYVTAKPSVLTSREDYKRLGYYANEFRKGNIQLEQIPYRYRSHLKPTREAQQKAYSSLVQTEAKERERYNNSSTGRFTNFLGNVATGVLAIPALGITTGATGAPVVAEAMSAPELLTSYKAPFTAKLATDFLGSTIAGEAVNTAAHHTGHSSFGDAVHDVLLPDRANINTFGDNAISSTLEFLNPGYIIGGIGADYLGKNGKVLFEKIKPLTDKLLTIPKAYYYRNLLNKEQKILREKSMDFRRLASLYQKRVDRLWGSQGKTTENPFAPRTAFKPFYSNNVDIINNELRSAGEASRISPTEILLSYNKTRPGINPVNPEIKLPENVTINYTQLRPQQYILKYPSNRWGKPELIIRKMSLADYQDLPDEIYYTFSDDIIKSINQESIDAARVYNPNNSTGIKEFGSLATIKEGYLPHLSNDADAITSRSYYDKYIKNRVPLHTSQTTREGYTHQYINSKGQTMPLDIVVIENGPDGLVANSNISLQLFAKQHPDEFAEALERAAVSKTGIKIPYTAEQLIDGVNPIEDTILDAFLSDKTKHISRVPLYLERADPVILQRVITKKGHIMFGKNYTPLRNIDVSNYEANLEFLAEIGYQGEHLQNLARSPERMKLIIEEYSQYLSGVSRGEDAIESLDDWIVRSTIWDPSIKGGNLMGSGKNTVALADSGYHPYYSNMQIDLNPYLEGRTPRDLIKLSKVMRGEMDLPSEISAVLSDSFKSPIKNIKDVDRFFNNLYNQGKSYADIKKELDLISSYIPYFETVASLGKFRGVYKTPSSALRFNTNSTQFPFEPMKNTSSRYNLDLLHHNNPNIETKAFKSRAQRTQETPLQIHQRKLENAQNNFWDTERKISKNEERLNHYNNTIEWFEFLVKNLIVGSVTAGSSFGLYYYVNSTKDRKKHRWNKKDPSYNDTEK